MLIGINDYLKMNWLWSEISNLFQRNKIFSYSSFSESFWRKLEHNKKNNTEVSKSFQSGQEFLHIVLIAWCLGVGNDPYILFKFGLRELYAEAITLK